MEAAVELAAAMSGQGALDIRLEAATAKMWHSEKAWELVNDAVQIRARTRLRNGRLAAAEGGGSVPGRAGAAGTRAST